MRLPKDVLLLVVNKLRWNDRISFACTSRHAHAVFLLCDKIMWTWRSGVAPETAFARHPRARKFKLMCESTADVHRVLGASRAAGRGNGGR